MANVRCPSCGAPVRAASDEAACSKCGQHMRIEEVPDRPCERCGKPVRADLKVATCMHCGRVQPGDARRRLRHMARCPRCRREMAVDRDQETATCTHCGQGMALGATL